MVATEAMEEMAGQVVPSPSSLILQRCLTFLFWNSTMAPAVEEKPALTAEEENEVPATAEALAWAVMADTAIRAPLGSPVTPGNRDPSLYLKNYLWK
jgi:hypothetical protein